MNTPLEVKVCAACGTEQYVSEFRLNKSTVDGRMKRCRSCERAGKTISGHDRAHAFARRLQAPLGHRWCPKCDTDKVFSDFGKDSKGAGGLRRWCRECENRVARERRPGEYVKVSEKTCLRCGKTKAIEAFHHDSRSVDYHRIYCAICDGKMGERDTRKRSQRSAEYRAWHLHSRYGLTVEDYEQMYSDQNGECFICHRWFEKLCVDHNHASGAVRKLLCSTCNTALGMVYENPVTIASMLDYCDEENV